MSKSGEERKKSIIAIFWHRATICVTSRHYMLPHYSTQFVRKSAQPSLTNPDGYTRYTHAELTRDNQWMLFFRDTYPMILVANKVDLVHLRKVTEEQGKEIAKTLEVGLTLYVILIFIYYKTIYFFPRRRLANICGTVQELQFFEAST